MSGEAAKYTPDEDALEIPCRVFLPSTGYSMLVDLTHLPVEAMTIDVIAHSLSTKARYNGHTPYPYSVALHSILVSLLLGKDPPLALQLEAILHDAAETYVGDLIHPIKRECPDFKLIENVVDDQLRSFYNLPTVETPDVKRADTRALWLEQYYLQGKRFSGEALADLTGKDLETAQAVLEREYPWKTVRGMFLGHYGVILRQLAS